MEDFDITAENLEDLQRQLDQMNEKNNTEPNPDFDYLCSLDIHQLIYSPFGPQSCLRFQSAIALEVLQTSPFFQLATDYLNLLGDAGELKLTPNGNLPRKMVIDLYGKGYLPDSAVEMGIMKVFKEQDYIPLSNLKIICQVGGLTKKRNNKISLTQKGLKLMAKPAQLFQHLFTIHLFKFNLGYNDLYEDDFQVQQTAAFTLYLLLKYGKEQCPATFYPDKHLAAFPMILETFMYYEREYSTPADSYERCYFVRLFTRFLHWYGVVDVTRENRFSPPLEIMATPLLFDILRIEPANFQFRKSKFEA